jgi:hypothetical protein
MISEEKLSAPLPWLAALSVLVWLVVVALQIFMPSSSVAVETLPAAAPAVSN